MTRIHYHDKRCCEESGKGRVIPRQKSLEGEDLCWIIYHVLPMTQIGQGTELNWIELNWTSQTVLAWFGMTLLQEYIPRQTVKHCCVDSQEEAIYFPDHCPLLAWHCWLCVWSRLDWKMPHSSLILSSQCLSKVIVCCSYTVFVVVVVVVVFNNLLLLLVIPVG